jgi:hypothetical protein
MKQMELTETTRKLGKCIVVKVMKQMEPEVHRGKGHEADGAH